MTISTAAMRLAGSWSKAAIPSGRRMGTRPFIYWDPVPDLIVLDYRMPGMDGITVLGVLRSYLGWFHVPVIILTAYPDEPRLRQLAELGVERIFVKAHFKFDELLEVIEERVHPRVPLQPNGDLGMRPGILATGAP